MKEFRTLTKEELTEEYNKARNALKEWEAKGLKLDLTRGKPGQAQLDLTTDMLSVVLAVAPGGNMTSARHCILMSFGG